MGLLNILLSDKKNTPKLPTTPITVDIAENIFSITLPSDAEIKTIETSKNLKPNSNQEKIATLLKANLSYPGKVFFQPSHGDLIIEVELLFSEINTNLFHREELQEFITKHYRSKYEEYNIKARKSAVIKNHVPTDEFYYYPEDSSSFYPHEENGLHFSAYNIVGKETHNNYALAITENALLNVGFHFNHTKSRGAWELMELAGAKEDAERILKTVNITYAKPKLKQSI